MRSSRVRRVLGPLAVFGMALLASWKLGPEAAAVTAAPGGSDEIYFRLVLGMLGGALPAGLVAAPLGLDVLFAKVESCHYPSLHLLDRIARLAPYASS